MAYTVEGFDPEEGRWDIIALVVPTRKAAKDKAHAAVTKPRFTRTRVIPVRIPAQ